MFLNRKFYSADADDGGFGGSVPINPFEGSKPEDFKMGFTEPEEVADENVVNDKKPEEEEVKVEPEPEVKVEIVAEKVEDVKEPEVKQEQVKQEQVKQPEFNLDEELKKMDKWELLKKAGLDDYEIGLLKYRAETGDVTPYLEAKSVDYSKLSDEQMMKYDLRKQYKGMSDKALDLLYERTMGDKYLLDAEVHGDAAAELGRELLKHEALKIRQSAIAEQAKFTAPAKQVDDSAQKSQAERETKIAEYKEYVTSNENTKALLANKKLVFGTGDTAFNYTVDNPQSVVDSLINPQLIFNDLVDTKGNVDVSKFSKVKAYAANPDKIEQMLINHGKTIGVKEYHAGLENSSKKTGETTSKAEPELTPAQALAKFGKIRQRDN